MITFTPYASGSSGNLYTVSDGQTTLMLDCGLPWKKVREKLNFQTSEIGGVLLTHLHQDHCRGAKDAALSGLDIYASRETLDALSVPEHRRNVVEDGRLFVVGSWHILPFSTIHDVPGAYGYYMVNFAGEAFLYLTDSAFSPVRFKRLDVVALECNFVPEVLSENVASGEVDSFRAHRTRRTHMSLNTVIEFLKANDLSHCKAAWILHLSSQNSDERRMVVELQQTVGVPVYVAAS